MGTHFSFNKDSVYENVEAQVSLLIKPKGIITIKHGTIQIQYP